MERTARFVSFDMTAVFTSPFLRNRVMKGRRKGEVDKKNPLDFVRSELILEPKYVFFFFCFVFNHLPLYLLFYSSYYFILSILFSFFFFF